MSPIILIKEDNLNVLRYLASLSKVFTFIYADMIYEDRNFSWIPPSLGLLRDNGVFVIQTDYHTAAEVKIYSESLGLNLINWCIYINDWGGVPAKGFPRKHDDILIFSKSKKFKWYPERIQIPKATAGTAFDKKGTGKKTPPDVFYDKPSFSTVARERIKLGDRLVRWQKPVWLMERLLLPFTDEKDSVLDLFMGTGTLAIACRKHKRKYFGIESSEEIFRLAERRLS